MLLPIDPVALARALQQHQLPPPIEVVTLGPLRATASFRLRFGAGARVPQLVLRCVMTETGHDPLATERAALRCAGLLFDLPVPGEYTLLPVFALGRRAALCGFIDGRPGDTLLDGAPGLAVLRAVGEALSALASLPQPGFATRATGEGAFVPRRGTWREEVGASLWASMGRARAAGAELGPLSQAVFEATIEALPALDTAARWALVHGDLHPGNLLFQGDDPRLVGLVDWESALVGDPLMDWAWSVEQLAPESLAGVLLGYGAERAAAELRAPEALARLELYTRARSIHRLAYASLRCHDVNQGRPRALLLERARTRCEAAREPGFVARKIEDALAHLSRPVARGLDLPAAWAGLSRRVFERLREGPEADPAELLRLAGALAAAGRVADGVGFESELVSAELQLAPRAPDAAPLSAEPIADRAGWRAGLVLAAQARRGTSPERSAALLLLALGLDAVDRLGGAVPDAALRGLEGAVRGLRAREIATAGALGHAEALAYGLLGLWAAERLSAEPATISALREQLRDALDEILAPGALAAAALPAELRPLVPAIQSALEAEAGAAVASSDEIARALPGFSSAASP